MPSDQLAPAEHLTIMILGAGVQGTLLGIRLARAGHSVTLVARGKRAAELRTQGAVVRNAITEHGDAMELPVVERLAADTLADLCFVLVRREQLEEVLPDLKAASGVGRIILMVNHANGSEWLFSALGRERVVLGFPSAGGSVEGGVDVYVNIAEQPVALERTAPHIAAILRIAGYQVVLVADMDSWLKRHAVFVTAVGGALYRKNCDARLLAADKKLVGTFIVAIREGWAVLDKLGVQPAPLGLRMILCWVPLPFAVFYWSRLFGSVRGEYYFARHTRHATKEMAALVEDLRAFFVGQDTPRLSLLYAAIDREPS